MSVKIEVNFESSYICVDEWMRCLVRVGSIQESSIFNCSIFTTTSKISFCSPVHASDMSCCYRTDVEYQ